MLLVLCSCSQKNSNIAITFGGDIMLARAGEAIFTKDNNVLNPWTELENNNIQFTGEDQYFFANLESPMGLSSPSSGKMNLCSDPTNADVLNQGNLYLVSLANNHYEDCQEGGDQQTQQILLEKGILSVSADLEPVYLEIPQSRMAVIAAEDISGSLDTNKLIDQVGKARETANLVIVSMHWGNEYQAGPDERQQALAQQLAEAGADVIWGHHPHVLQRMEWLHTTDGREVLVLYSLGNLLSDQWMLEDVLRSALVRVTFQENEIANIEIIPVLMDMSDKTLHLVLDAKSRNHIVDRLQVDELFVNNIEVTIR